MPSGPRAIEGRAWLPFLLGLGLVYALLQGSASALGSDRGEAGVIVGALVVAALLGVERFLFGAPVARAAQTLGLGRPLARGLLTATALCLGLLLVFPVFAAVTGTPLDMYPRWAWHLPGLFAQAGIAEEILFRGYLFGRVRATRPFWRAVAVASMPFIAVHLVLFATMPWPIALAALALSVLISAPLAHLFELGGGTIWAPAFLHFVVQGAIKMITTERADSVLPLVWMAATAVIPYLVFLVRRDASVDARASTPPT